MMEPLRLWTVPRDRLRGRTAGERRRYHPGMDEADRADLWMLVRRFNQKERFKLLRDGIPIGAIRMLRTGYVEAMLANPEAMRQLRAEFGIIRTTGEDNGE